jgi:putative hydrolase of HD superfamily
LLTLVEGLSPEPFNEFKSLWDEYRTATSPEAVAVKAFDKLETLMQSNQGINPPLSVDFVFSLSYGREYTDGLTAFAEVRRLVDQDTQRKAVEYGAGH